MASVSTGKTPFLHVLSGRVQLFSMEEQIPKWLQRLELIDSYRLQPDLEEKGRYELYGYKVQIGFDRLLSPCFRFWNRKGLRISHQTVQPEVRLTDVGFGVSQVLPVLILCYYAPEGSILILEQPEAHLHPKVQSELGGCFD